MKSVRARIQTQTPESIRTVEGGWIRAWDLNVVLCAAAASVPAQRGRPPARRLLADRRRPLLSALQKPEPALLQPAHRGTGNTATPYAHLHAVEQVTRQRQTVVMWRTRTQKPKVLQHHVCVL